MFEYFRNVRIKTISYGLIIIMIVAGAIIGFASFSTLREVDAVRATWNSYADTAVKKTGYLSDLRDDLGYGGFIHNFKNAILRRDKSLLDAVVAKQKAALQDINNYRARGVDAQEETALSDLEDMINEYASKVPIIDSMIDQGATPEAIDSQVRISDTSAIDGIAALLEHVRQERADFGASVNATMDSAQQYTYLTLTIVAILIVSLIAVFLWFAQSRLVRPIYALVEFVTRVGRGDLTQQMGNLGRDEVGGLGSQLNQMVANLKEITVQTREAVANLNSAATETLASTKQQAASVEEQFAAIQETTATLDEISQSGQQMSSRARDIAGQAEKASERSKDGLKSMDDLAQVMDAIEEQTESVASHIVALSEKTQAIGDIISTVNDIAERSQLLALNAAIEAAAAGEEGRSFSVVAEEIRTLADQAKEATTQVSSILGDIQKGINASVMSTEESVKRVANGREQAENTLKSITELAETIEASVQAFEQIVASTNQQKIGLEQVTQALQQIRTGSEQTAAGTKQIEQAVTNINSLGSQLDHTMERYAV